MNANKNTSAKSLKVVSKSEQKTLSIPTKKLPTKAVTKAIEKKIIAKLPKVVKAKFSFHKALIACNNADKLEIYSLSGAINRLKKQVFANDEYCKIDTNVLLKGFEFSVILANVAQRNIDKQKFSLYAVGLSFNKYLKTVI